MLDKILCWLGTHTTKTEYIARFGKDGRCTVHIETTCACGKKNSKHTMGLRTYGVLQGYE